MQPLPPHPGLDDAFDPAGPEVWSEAARRALRGRSLESLDASLLEGIELPTMVFDAPAPAPPPDRPPWTRGWRADDRRAAGWDVRACVLGGEARGAQAVAAGARSLWLRTDAAVEPSQLERWLGGVDLAAVPVHLEVEGCPRAWLDAVAARADGPLTGALVARRPSGPDWADEAALHRDVSDRHPWMHLGCASSLRVANAGGTAVHQLGVLLAAVADRLRGLDAEGVGPEAVLPRLLLQVGVDRELWTSVALLRAARTAWARLAAACGVHSPGFLHAVTVDLARSRRDPWTNVIRDTLAVTAAAWGGADAITAIPRDARAVEEASAAAQRLATTGQRVLCDEAHLARVADAVGGSRVVETLTAELDAKGWAFFQRIEGAGGLARSLAEGWLAAEVKQVAAERLRAARRRRPLLVGSAGFVEAGSTRAAPASSAGSLESAADGLTPLCLTEPFESLQDAADSASHRPRVLLWHLEAEVAHQPRAEFTRRLLEAGGLAIDDVFELDGADPAAAVVLIARDEVYAVRLDAALAEAAAHPFVAVAGKVDPAWTPASAHSLYLGCDAVAVLTALHHALGVLG